MCVSARFVLSPSNNGVDEDKVILLVIIAVVIIKHVNWRSDESKRQVWHHDCCKASEGAELALEVARSLFASTEPLIATLGRGSLNFKRAREW